MNVVLFDIDGTLLSTGGAGTYALREALRDAFGVAEPQDVPVSGRTDRGIARNMLLTHGLPDTDDNWRQFRDAYLRHLGRQLPLRPGRVLPGVHELLGSLAGRVDVLIGLLTGNLHEGARLKLRHYQLDHHFAFGGFGDRHPDRDSVAAEALAATRAHAGERPISPDRVWVIGDTPFDITCGRSIGAKTVAVATGTYERDSLAAFEPDMLLDTLDAVPDLVNRLLGP